MSQESQESGGANPQSPPHAYPGQAQPYPQQYPQAPQYGQPQQYPGHPQQVQQYPGQPYPQGQPYPGQAYGQPAAYPTAAYPATTAYRAPQRKSPMLGIIGFTLVVITGIVGVVLGMSLAVPLSVIMTYLPQNPEMADMTMVPPDVLEAATGPMSGLGFASLAGLVGWILSIIAAIAGRGRGWGVAGIILGIVAPIAVVISMSVALAGVLS